MNLDIRLFAYRIADLDTASENYTGHIWFIENITNFNNDLKWVIRHHSNYLCNNFRYGSISSDIYFGDSFEEALEFLKSYINSK